MEKMTTFDLWANSIENHIDKLHRILGDYQNQLNLEFERKEAFIIRNGCSSEYLDVKHENALARFEALQKQLNINITLKNLLIDRQNFGLMQ